VCLTETRHRDPSAFELFFPEHDVYHLPASRLVRGLGVLTLVHKRLRKHVKPVASPDPLLQLVTVRILPPAVPLPLTVLNCYVPHATSPQLADISQLDIFQHLTALCQQYNHSHVQPAAVVLGGDLNAHVLFLAEDPQGVDAAGNYLVELANNCDLEFCLLHDEDNLPTYCAQGPGGPVSSCPDHILSSATLPATVASEVCMDMPGSDHRPLTAVFKWHNACSLPDMILQPHHLDGRLQWQGREQDYCAEILSAVENGSFEDAMRMLDDPDTADHAYQSVMDLVRTAATTSGHYKSPRVPTSTASIPRPTTSKPWFDAECRQAFEHHRHCLRHLPYGHESLRLAARAYERICRRKQRLWADQATQDLAAQARLDPRTFWKRFGASQRQAPIAASADDVTACVTFLQAVFVTSDVPLTSVAPGMLSDCSEHPLNQPFTEHEVSAVLGKLSNGLSCGPDGVPAEFLKYAVERHDQGHVKRYLLAPYLTCMYNHFFDAGKVPASWGAALLSLVFKKGDRKDWGNYRPLAVTQLAAKIYALLLVERLTIWAEEHQLITPAQVGFRPRHSSLLNNFVLQHLIDKGRKDKVALFSCFVDLKQAYDRVVRDHVWQYLHAAGCQGRMLHAVVALYAHVTYSVKFQNGASLPFHTNTGLRQGCPLSPFLFNFVMQKLWDGIQDLCPTSGPQITFRAAEPTSAPPSGGVGGVMPGAGAVAVAGPSGAAEASAQMPPTNQLYVPALMYADDVDFLARRLFYSQSQMHTLELFLEDEHMVPGFDKTRLVVFNASYQTAAERRTALRLLSRRIEKATEYDHLGLMTKQRGTPNGMIKHVAKRGQAAIALLHRKIKEMDLTPTVGVMLMLFQAVVLPNLTFGCEVWGPWFLQPNIRDGAFQNELEHVRLSFLRMLLGLKSSTPLWNLWPASWFAG